MPFYLLLLNIALKVPFRVKVEDNTVVILLINELVEGGHYEGMIYLVCQCLLIGLILQLLLCQRVQRYFRHFDGTNTVVKLSHSLENMCVSSLSKE